MSAPKVAGVSAAQAPSGAWQARRLRPACAAFAGGTGAPLSGYAKKTCAARPSATRGSRPSRTSPPATGAASRDRQPRRRPEDDAVPRAPDAADGEGEEVARVGHEGARGRARRAPRAAVVVLEAAAAVDVVRRDERDLGSKREIQRRFNVSVPRARVPEKASTLRDRSER